MVLLFYGYMTRAHNFFLSFKKDIQLMLNDSFWNIFKIKTPLCYTLPVLYPQDTAGNVKISCNIYGYSRVIKIDFRLSMIKSKNLTIL